MSIHIATSGFSGGGLCIATGGYSCAGISFADAMIVLDPMTSSFKFEAISAFDVESTSSFKMDDNFNRFESAQVQTDFKLFRRLT